MLSTIGSLLYIPVEWISEIEVTVVTDHFAHMMKAELDEDCELVGEFNTRTKTRVDYYCDGGRAIVDVDDSEVKIRIDNENIDLSNHIPSGEEVQEVIGENISGGIK